MKRWLVIAVLLGVIWIYAPEYGRLVEQNTRYAAIIAAAANGGQFAIGEGWLVSCKGKRIPAVY